MRRGTISETVSNSVRMRSWITELLFGSHAAEL